MFQAQLIQSVHNLLPQIMQRLRKRSHLKKIASKDNLRVYSDDTAVRIESETEPVPCSCGFHPERV